MANGGHPEVKQRKKTGKDKKAPATAKPKAAGAKQTKTKGRSS